MRKLNHKKVLSICSDLSAIEEWQNKLDRRVKAGLVNKADRLLAQNCLDEMKNYNDQLLDKLLMESKI
jgi:hypothetical protein